MVFRSFIMDAEKAGRVIAEGAPAGVPPIRALRERAGVTREALAKATGIAPDLIMLFEEHADVARPTADHVEALARFFGIPADTLLPPAKHQT